MFAYLILSENRKLKKFSKSNIWKNASQRVFMQTQKLAQLRKLVQLRFWNYI